MSARSAVAVSALLFASSLLVVSCSDSNPTDGDPPGDTTPPAVLSVTPADGATDVSLIGRFQIAFSESLDPATIGDDAIFVASRDVGGYVEYDAATKTAVFTPDTVYVANADLELVVAPTVTDLAGNHIAGNRTTPFATGPLDEAHVRDPFYPNQTIAEAQELEFGRYYRTLSLWGDDRDIFEFTVTETLKVNASTRVLYADHSPWLTRFLRADGAEYARSSLGQVTANSFGSLMFTFAPGTYYVCIGDTTVPGYALYTIRLLEMEKCVDDAYEDNDFLDEAAPLAPGTYTDMRCCDLDQDFYAIDVVAGETLTVDITWGWTSGGWFKLLDPSGATVQEFQPGWSPIHFQTVAGQTGAYVVSTRFVYEGAYQMEVTVEE
jgi:hypothetical protein